MEGVAKIQDEYIEEFDGKFVIEPDAGNQVVGIGMLGRKWAWARWFKI